MFPYAASPVLRVAVVRRQGDQQADLARVAVRCNRLKYQGMRLIVLALRPVGGRCLVLAQYRGRGNRDSVLQQRVVVTRARQYLVKSASFFSSEAAASMAGRVHR